MESEERIVGLIEQENILFLEDKEKINMTMLVVYDCTDQQSKEMAEAGSMFQHEVEQKDYIFHGLDVDIKRLPKFFYDKLVESEVKLFGLKTRVIVRFFEKDSHGLYQQKEINL